MIAFFSIISATASANTAASHLSVNWTGPSGSQDLQKWLAADLPRVFRTVRSTEKDPANGKFATWTGVPLQELVEKALEKLPLESRATIDLLIFQTAQGTRVIVPRSVLRKYPLLVAFKKDGIALPGLQLVAPWSTKPRIMEEGLPVEKYFIPMLASVELANYRERYATLYLKRRTDPSAMRGEKIFVQNCATCHDTGKGVSIGYFSTEPKVRMLASAGHPPVKGRPKLSDRDQRALINYLDAYRNENGVDISKAQSRAVLPEAAESSKN